jgi:hypothetical protein
MCNLTGTPLFRSKSHESTLGAGIFAKTPGGAEIFSIPCRTISVMS